ncbi:MAG: hypothetical protein ACI9FJ_001865, partial [Alteromonadaceae bacterium]
KLSHLLSDRKAEMIHQLAVLILKKMNCTY